MSGEPKTLTLTFQEAVELLGRDYRAALVFLPYSPDQLWDAWSTLSIDEEGYAVEDFAPTWEETMSSFLGVRVVARDEVAELREENKRLSASVDDLLLAPNPLDDENMRLRTEAAELRAALDVARDAMVSALVYHHHSLGNPVKEELNAAVNRAGRALAGGEEQE